MSERGVGKPWTTYEDNLLIQAVAIHGENDNWKAVALSVPGRTNKACRKRWLHSLSPNVKKTAWTPEEDQLLLSLYATHGTKWSVIARHIPGRTDDACSKRYREALDPSLKRDDWTAEEDAKLLEAYSRLGGKWGLIGQELSRSGLGCRNRWRMLERKRVAAARDTAGRGEASSTTSAPPSQWAPNPTVIQDAQSWDGRSPQYVTPSMLFNSSPSHPQEPQTTAYLPEQILSGVHLTGTTPRSPGAPQLQYGSSSLDGALSHPGPISHSPNRQEFYTPTDSYSPTTSLSQGTAADGGAHAHSYGTDEYAPMPVSNGGVPHAVPAAYQQQGVEPDTGGNQPTLSAGTDVVPAGTGPEIISDSPASPSPASPPIPLDTPLNSPPTESAALPLSSAPTDSAHAPRPYYRTEAEKAQQLPALRKVPNTQRPTRLSSLLPATADATVLAYACGHRDCWPSDAPRSSSAFVTSKELSDHNKVDHGGDLGGTKPFRCGLSGCEKSWKSINGLQYHLQISKVHFQQALATRRTTSGPTSAVDRAPGAPTQDISPSVATDNDRANSPPTAAPADSAPAVLGDSPGAENASPAKPKRKLHPCPRPGCGKQYKQLSGLRYHLSHGHMDELPMQLDYVPPTLARMVEEETHAAPV
ncbi:hypothetical protein BD413DRAFT_479387 [Trametes elegans]|nr:hypothetical protein BD413DRAFT_479387 [Trametes elegans]